MLSECLEPLTILQCHNMCLQSVWNHSPYCSVTIRTTRTPNYTAIRNQNLACISLHGSHPTVYYATTHTHSAEHNTGLFAFKLLLLDVCCMFQSVQRPSSGMTTQKILIMKDIINSTIKFKKDAKMQF